MTVDLLELKSLNLVWSRILLITDFIQMISLVATIHGDFLWGWTKYVRLILEAARLTPLLFNPLLFVFGYLICVSFILSFFIIFRTYISSQRGLWIMATFLDFTIWGLYIPILELLLSTFCFGTRTLSHETYECGSGMSILFIVISSLLLIKFFYITFLRTTFYNNLDLNSEDLQSQNTG